MEWVIALSGLLVAVLGLILGEGRARRAERRADRDRDVSPWSEARWLSGDAFAVTNRSMRDVVVTSVEPDHVVTTEPVHNFAPRNELPFRVNAGDTVEFDSERRLTLPRPAAVIEWQFVDSERSRSTRRIVTGLNPNDGRPPA
jgi:hypothetical protein